MVYKNDPSYLWLKGRIYYYNRHIPRDVRHHYDVTRLVICLKTRRHDLAVKAAARLSHQLEDYWTTLRFGLKTFQALSDQCSEAPSLSNSLETYLRLKGGSKGKIFEQSAKRSVGLAISIIEDKPLTEYSTSDATKLRDHMLLNGLKVATVKRNLSTLRSIVNLNKTELGLDFSNPFTGIFLPDLNDAKIRNPIPECELTSIQQECLRLDDEQRLIIALLSDTGMRLSETLGLLVEDIKIDTAIPHIALTPHPWRQLKTKSSLRKIPLIGSSLRAAKRIVNSATSDFAFPGYTSAKRCNANSASAAINKWLKPRLPEGCVIHSFRHSFRDRLRNVDCPTEVIDQLGGWSSSTIGSKYGKGYSLAKLHEWLLKIEYNSSPVFDTKTCESISCLNKWRAREVVRCLIYALSGN